MFFLKLCIINGMKLWVRAFKHEKIILNELIVDSAPLSVANLSAALRDVCDKKDLPCPIITETNLNNLINFNHTKFKQSDFLEKINFDYLEIGNIPK